MKTIYLIVISLFGSFTFCLAQNNNYKPGYVITNEMDTIYGLIDYRVDAMNAKFCMFKKDETSRVQMYSPGEIYGYRFSQEGKFYITYEIILDDNPRTVFIEYLIDGMMSLYFYEDIDTQLRYYFFEDEEGNLTSISKKQDEMYNVRERTIAKEDNRYKGAINFLFHDYEGLKKDVKNVEFDHESMIKLTKNYHDLTCPMGEECIIFETIPDKNYTKWSPYIYAGVQAFAIGDVFDELDITGYAPIIGFGIDISSPRRTQYVSAFVDVSISKLQRTLSENTSFYRGYIPRYDSYALTMQVGAKFIYPKGKIRPFCELGFQSFDCLFSQTVEFTPVVSSDLSTASNEMTLHGDNKFSLGFHAAVGLQYQINKQNSVFLKLQGKATIVWGAMPLVVGYTF